MWLLAPVVGRPLARAEGAASPAALFGVTLGEPAAAPAIAGANCIAAADGSNVVCSRHRHARRCRRWRRSGCVTDGSIRRTWSSISRCRRASPSRSISGAPVTGSWPRSGLRASRRRSPTGGRRRRPTTAGDSRSWPLGARGSRPRGRGARMEPTRPPRRRVTSRFASGSPPTTGSRGWCWGCVARAHGAATAAGATTAAGCEPAAVAEMLLDLFPPAPVAVRRESARRLAACHVNRAAGALGAVLAQDPAPLVQEEALRALAQVDAAQRRRSGGAGRIARRRWPDSPARSSRPDAGRRARRPNAPMNRPPRRRARRPPSRRRTTRRSPSAGSRPALSRHRHRHPRRPDPRRRAPRPRQRPQPRRAVVSRRTPARTTTSRRRRPPRAPPPAR